MAGASPAFRVFLGEWREQISAFWLADLAPLRGASLLLCAVLVPLAGSALLIGGAAHLLLALLGAARMAEAFPYLQPALALWHLPGEPWLLLGVVAVVGMLGVAWLPARLPRALRRRWWALLALLTPCRCSTSTATASSAWPWNGGPPPPPRCSAATCAATPTTGSNARPPPLANA